MLIIDKPVWIFSDGYLVFETFLGSLEEIQDFLKDDPELSDEERFELYYDEREKRREKKSGLSYEQLLKKSGVLPPSAKK